MATMADGFHKGKNIMQLEPWEARILMKAVTAQLNDTVQRGAYSFDWIKERLNEINKYVDFLLPDEK